MPVRPASCVAVWHRGQSPDGWTALWASRSVGGRGADLDCMYVSVVRAARGERDVAAEFWLLDAPTSIARQSEMNADGYGLAALTARRGMVLIRNPVQASEDPAYRHVARRLDASEMLVHLRYASTGDVSLLNTHPFSQDGRLFAGP